jgi:hypothetical protein
MERDFIFRMELQSARFQTESQKHPTECHVSYKRYHVNAQCPTEVSHAALQLLRDMQKLSCSQNSIHIIALTLHRAKINARNRIILYTYIAACFQNAVKVHDILLLLNE